MNKKALESCFISEKIHYWIDLIFGVKQSGKDAIEFLNVYRKACYNFEADSYLCKLLDIKNNNNNNNNDNNINYNYEKIRKKLIKYILNLKI